MRIAVLPGVLRPPSDCWLLASVARDHALTRNASVLDVFTGSGALAVSAALDRARRVTAVDISWRAVLNARLNAALNRVRVRVLRGDLFAPVAGDRFDLILGNPPYLPSETDRLPSHGAARAWEGGIHGRAFLDRFCAQAADHLTDRGHVLLVQSSLAGEEATLECLERSGLHPEVVARRRGPLGPLLASRALILEQRGLLARGEREEELLVIAGRRRHPQAASRANPARAV